MFGLLVLACIGAFFLTQHVKHLPTAVQDFKLATRFSPYRQGSESIEAISFELEHPDAATVTIVDSSGNRVATLVRNYPVGNYHLFSLRWDGRRGTARHYRVLRSATGRPLLLALCPGPIAPAGEYRVVVRLQRQHKTVSSPKSFLLEGAP